MKFELQIVCDKIPFPPDYGGGIDMFYRIKWLSENDVDIILHCFKYGDREPSDVLKNLTKKVYYYDRKTGGSGLHWKLPYIVSSRINNNLLNNLSSHTSPILFEGIHCSYYLNHKKLKGHFKMVRTHNVEHHYYYKLYQNSRSYKKWYYYFEAKRLKNFEWILGFSNVLLPICDNDLDHFESHFKNLKIEKIGPFHEFQNISIKDGLGNYAIFYGSLAVDENERSALFLINEVFSQLEIPLIIAGSNPSKLLKEAVNEYSNVTLHSNPKKIDLDRLIQNAQVLCMHSSQATGIKLKFIHAVYRGRHIIANDDMITDDSLSSIVEIANDKDNWIQKIQELMLSNIDENKMKERYKAEKLLSTKNQGILLKRIISNGSS